MSMLKDMHDCMMRLQKYGMFPQEVRIFERAWKALRHEVEALGITWETQAVKRNTIFGLRVIIEPDSTILIP